jgi:hypothetical protein
LEALNERAIVPDALQMIDSTVLQPMGFTSCLGHL